MCVYVATWMFNIDDDPDDGLIGVYAVPEAAYAAASAASAAKERKLAEQGADVNRDQDGPEADSAAMHICLTASYATGEVDTYHFTVVKAEVQPGVATDIRLVANGDQWGAVAELQDGTEIPVWAVNGHEPGETPPWLKDEKQYEDWYNRALEAAHEQGIVLEGEVQAGTNGGCCVKPGPAAERHNRNKGAAMAEEQRKQVNLNREANYGGLVDMDSHVASVGIEMPDDESRGFRIFRHHTTAVGDDRIATMAFRWMASPSTLTEIRRNTDYSPGAKESTFSLNRLLGVHGEIMVRMTATCRDGKCLLAAYVDPVLWETGDGT